MSRPTVTELVTNLLSGNFSKILPVAPQEFLTRFFILRSLWVQDFGNPAASADHLVVVFRSPETPERPWFRATKNAAGAWTIVNTDGFAPPGGFAPTDVVQTTTWVPAAPVPGTVAPSEDFTRGSALATKLELSSLITHGGDDTLTGIVSYLSLDVLPPCNQTTDEYTRANLRAIAQGGRIGSTTTREGLVAIVPNSNPRVMPFAEDSDVGSTEVGTATLRSRFASPVIAGNGVTTVQVMGTQTFTNFVTGDQKFEIQYQLNPAAGDTKGEMYLHSYWVLDVAGTYNLYHRRTTVSVGSSVAAVDFVGNADIIVRPPVDGAMYVGYQVEMNLTTPPTSFTVVVYNEFRHMQQNGDNAFVVLLSSFAGSASINVETAIQAVPDADQATISGSGAMLPLLPNEYSAFVAYMRAHLTGGVVAGPRAHLDPVREMYNHENYDPDGMIHAAHQLETASLAASPFTRWLWKAGDAIKHGAEKAVHVAEDAGKIISKGVETAGKVMKGAEALGALAASAAYGYDPDPRHMSSSAAFGYRRYGATSGGDEAEEVRSRVRRLMDALRKADAIPRVYDDPEIGPPESAFRAHQAATKKNVNREEDSDVYYSSSGRFAPHEHSDIPSHVPVIKARPPSADDQLDPARLAVLNALRTNQPVLSLDARQVAAIEQALGVVKGTISSSGNGVFDMYSSTDEEDDPTPAPVPRPRPVPAPRRKPPPVAPRTRVPDADPALFSGLDSESDDGDGAAADPVIPGGSTQVADVKQVPHLAVYYQEVEPNSRAGLQAFRRLSQQATLHPRAIDNLISQFEDPADPRLKVYPNMGATGMMPLGSPETPAGLAAYSGATVKKIVDVGGQQIVVVLRDSPTGPPTALVTVVLTTTKIPIKGREYFTVRRSVDTAEGTHTVAIHMDTVFAERDADCYAQAVNLAAFIHNAGLWENSLGPKGGIYISLGLTAPAGSVTGDSWGVAACAAMLGIGGPYTVTGGLSPLGEVTPVGDIATKAQPFIRYDSGDGETPSFPLFFFPSGNRESLLNAVTATDDLSQPQRRRALELCGAPRLGDSPIGGSISSIIELVGWLSTALAGAMFSAPKPILDTLAEQRRLLNLTKYYTPELFTSAVEAYLERIVPDDAGGMSKAFKKLADTSNTQVAQVSAEYSAALTAVNTTFAKGEANAIGGPKLADGAGAPFSREKLVKFLAKHGDKVKAADDSEIKWFTTTENGNTRLRKLTPGRWGALINAGVVEPSAEFPLVIEAGNFFGVPALTGGTPVTSGRKTDKKAARALAFKDKSAALRAKLRLGDD